MSLPREEVSLTTENQELKSDIPPSLVNTNHSFFKFDKTLVKPTVIESVVALTSACIATPFTSKDTSWYAQPFSMTCAMLIFNFFCRAYQIDSSESNDQTLQKLIMILCSMTFAGVDDFVRTTLVHESGHMIAYLCLYQNVRLNLRLDPPLGAATLHEFYGVNNTGILSEYGAMLGEDKTTAVISAAGPAVELFFDYIMFITAEAISNNYPQLKWHLRLVALYSVLSTTVYVALGILSSCSEPNDFCSIDKYANIPLNDDIGFIVGSALLLQLCLYCCKKLNKHCQARSARLFNAPEHSISIEMKEHHEDVADVNDSLLTETPRVIELTNCR